MNPLDAFPAVRRALYLVQFVVSGALLLLGVAFGAIPDFEVPTWYTVATVVAAALWTYLGLTAAGNTHPEPVIPADQVVAQLGRRRTGVVAGPAALEANGTPVKVEPLQ